MSEVGYQAQLTRTSLFPLIPSRQLLRTGGKTVPFFHLSVFDIKKNSADNGSKKLSDFLEHFSLSVETGDPLASKETNFWLLKRGF